MWQNSSGFEHYAINTLKPIETRLLHSPARSTALNRLGGYNHTRSNCSIRFSVVCAGPGRLLFDYLDATKTQEEIALNYGYKNKSEASRRFSEVSCIFTDIGKMQLPYKITITEDGIKKEKQFVKNIGIGNFAVFGKICNFHHTEKKYWSRDCPDADRDFKVFSKISISLNLSPTTVWWLPLYQV